MLAQVLVSSVGRSGICADRAWLCVDYKGTGVVHFGYGDQVMFGAYLVLIRQVVVGLPFWSRCLPR
jgi:branched-chain amino acid transport system permease protein